jgi:nucleolar protein 9
MVEPTPQPYPPSLLATPVGTHTLEAIIRLSPKKIFEYIWHLYFEGKVGRLAGHPFANFAVSRGVGRLDEQGVREVVRECRAVAGGRGLISE